MRTVIPWGLAILATSVSASAAENVAYSANPVPRAMPGTRAHVPDAEATATSKAVAPNAPTTLPHELGRLERRLRRLEQGQTRSSPALPPSEAGPEVKTLTDLRVNIIGGVIAGIIVAAICWLSSTLFSSGRLPPDSNANSRSGDEPRSKWRNRGYAWTQKDEYDKKVVAGDDSNGRLW